MKLAAVDAVGMSSERDKGNRMSHVAENAAVVRVVAGVVVSGKVASVVAKGKIKKKRGF